MVDTTLFSSMVHHSQNVTYVGASSVVHVLLLVCSDKNARHQWPFAGEVGCGFYH